MNHEEKSLRNFFPTAPIAEQGILFVGTGEKYRKEIELSVSSIRRVMPSCEIAIFSDEDPKISGVHFFEVSEPSFSFLDKVKFLRETPFERTLFLDTDTFVLKPLEELFGLLQSFDLMAAHESAREHDFIEPIPSAFPELNSGVIVFRRSQEVGGFLDDFLTTYEPLVEKVAGDQTAFRLCLYRSQLKVWILPSEFNCQIRQAGFLGAEVKILHGRNLNLRNVGERINRYDGKRVHLPSPIFLGVKIVRFSRVKLKSWTVIWYFLSKLRILKQG